MKGRHHPAICLAFGAAAILGGAWDTDRALPLHEGISDAKISEARGVQDDQLYFQIGDATINAFNFNLSMALTEKVGFPLDVDGGLSVALSATYNSNFYNRRSHGHDGQGGLRICPEAKEDFTIDYLYYPRENPLGPGWEFHLGRIYRRQGNGKLWTYIAPDGQEHPLRRVQDASDLYESMEGSRIRARQFPGAQGWEVYLSDGRVLEMRHVVRGVSYAQPLSLVPEDPPPAGYHCSDDEQRACTPATLEQDCDPGHCAGTSLPCFLNEECDGPPSCLNAPTCDVDVPPQTHDLDKIGYHTSRIRTREALGFGSPAAYADITYHDAPFDYIVATIRDSHFPDDPTGQREIVTSINDFDPQLPSYGHITRVSFPSPPGENGQPQPRADFEFGYETDSLLGVEMDYLIRIDYPQGYAMTLDYYRTGIDGVWPQGFPQGHGGTPDYGGKLERIVHPSGKMTVFTYGAFERKWRERLWDATRSTTNSWDCACATAVSQTRFVGVRTVEVFPDAADPELSYVTTYDTRTVLVAEHDDAEATCESGCYSTSKYWDSVSARVDPAGNLTEIRYDTSSNPFGDTGPREPADYATFGTAVQERRYGGSSGFAAEPLETTTRTWTQIDSNGCFNVSWAEPTVETTTRLDDDPPTRVTTEHSDWTCGVDAIHGRPAACAWGRYETTTTSGNGIGDWEKIVTTDRAIDNTDAGGHFCPAAAELQASWLPDVVAGEAVRVRVAGGEPEPVSLTQYAFDTTTGRVTDEIVRLEPIDPDPCAHTRSAIAPTEGDLVAHFEYDDAGNVAADQVSFGDASAEVYRWEYDYAFGTRTRQQNVALAYNDYVATVDPASGLVLAQDYGATAPGDPVAVARRRVYDVLRRPVMEQVGGMEPWRYEYPSAPLPDRVRLAAVRTYQGSGRDRVESLVHYDTAGRVFKNEKLIPDGGRAYRHTRFDPAGRVEFVSEWTDRANDDPGLVGTTTDYSHPTLNFEDPFDRPYRVTGPLGEVTRYDYFGTNTAVTVEGIAGRDGSTFDATTIYYTDGLGRLRIVDSPAGADAIYDYDAPGNLTRVNLVAAVDLDPALADRYATSNSAGQLRSFAYDALGRQTDATHPERGRVQTFSWTPLGAAREIQDQQGRDRGYFHRTIFDDAGRPRRVERVLQDPGKAVEDQTFAAGSAGWSLDGWRTTTAGDCLEQVAWYQGDGSCRYAQSAIQRASLTSPAIAIPAPEGAQLSFRYFRQVRDDVAAGTPRDELTVRVAREEQYVAPGFDWSEAEEVFAVDSTQFSWSEWRRSPAIPLDDYAGATIKVHFAFDSVDTHGGTQEKGIGISEVRVERAAATILHETAYDETFGLVDNKSRGQATTVTVYDESTHLAALVQRFLFRQSEGRLSEERVSLDWDRDGTIADFSGSYHYDALGRTTSRVLPHLTSEDLARELLYSYRHGALTGVTSVHGGVEQQIVPDSPAEPGIRYNLAGGPQRIRHGNALVAHVRPNAAYLPERIWVDRDGAGPRPFDTGAYEYDGARKIRAIGGDDYRYDAVGRLVQASVASADFPGGLFLDYGYDAYGNMTDRATGFSFGHPEPAGLGPAGLDFRGRSYTDPVTGEVDNRIHDPVFAHDANGNVIEGPDLAGAGELRYVFSTENRLRLVRGRSRGQVLQESLYDVDGQRWTRIVSHDGGAGRVTLRDASGQVAAEYVEKPGHDGLRLERHYVRGNGTLMATHRSCGPPPSLEWSEPMAPLPRLDLVKTDHVTPAGDYTIVVESGTGEINVLTRPPSLPDHFSLSTDDMFPGHNRIHLQARVECGRTGYGDAVSVNLELTPKCLTAAAPSRSAGGSPPPGGPAQTVTRLAAIERPCPAGSRYDVSFPSNADDAGMRSAGPISRPPPTNPRGTHDSRSAGSETAAVPSMTTDYVFTDHLGSTRHVADELGVAVASYRYYPFGHYAEVSGAGELRIKYAGHERDERLGLDYMLARYYGSSLGRFLSVDPVTLTAGRQQDPQRLNLFAYALNSPLNYRDPSGEDVDVGNRAVGGTLGIGGHSFTIVTPTGANVQKYADRIDPNTGAIHLSGFPVEDPLTGDTLLVGAENDPRDVGNADQVIGIPAPQGTSMEQFESNVVEAFDSYQNNQPYAVLPGAGEFNSNSLTSGLLTAGGAEQIPDRGDLDRFNPGWDTPVPLPDATADDPPQQQRTP